MSTENAFGRAGASVPDQGAPYAGGSRIALFGAKTLLARELRSVLEDRAFPTLDVKLYDTGGEGTLSEYAGEALVVTSPDEDSIVGLDIAFMCGSRSESASYLGWPARLGYVAIDLSGASHEWPGVPVVHAEINAGRVDLRAPVIAVPSPIAHNLASVIAAVREAAPVVDVEAVALRPVSDLGEDGIDELHRQTVGLLNFTEVPRSVFGHQVAFNVLPSSGMTTFQAEGFDGRVRDEAAAVLQMPPERIGVASAFVALFHGHALAVTLTFARTPVEADLRQAVRAARGVRLVEDPDLATPVDLAGEEAVAVLGLRTDPRRPDRAALWSVCDNLKGGAVLNAVRVAERVADLRTEAR